MVACRKSQGELPMAAIADVGETIGMQGDATEGEAMLLRAGEKRSLKMCSAASSLADLFYKDNNLGKGLDDKWTLGLLRWAEKCIVQADAG